MDARTERIEQILQVNEDIITGHLALCENRMNQEDPWLTVSLTMPQFKTLLLVSSAQDTGVTVSFIAKKIGVGLPTVTGILDRLYEQQLISRSEDKVDRRITRIFATEKGLTVINDLHSSARNHWRELLGLLDDEGLQLVEQAFHLLYQTALRYEKSKRQS